MWQSLIYSRALYLDANPGLLHYVRKDKPFVISFAMTVSDPKLT
jgi:hypothetical protein